MTAALAVGCNDDWMSVIEMIQVILKGRAYIFICQVECLLCINSIIGQIGFDFGLPVPGCVDQCLIKGRRLVKYRGIISFGIKRCIIYISIPSFIFAISKRSWMDKKNINC